MSTLSLLVLVAGVAGAELAARGYLGARPLLFQAGLWLLVGVLVGLALRARPWRVALRARPRRVAALVGGCAAAGLALLSVAELTASAPADTPTTPGWSYRETGGDPAAFAAWAARHPDVARTGAERAPSERTIPAKGEHYRILLLGGPHPSDGLPAPAPRPWAAALDSHIRRTLRCATPVEVVQGGREGQSLRESATRFGVDVARLEPDLVVLQHHPFGDLTAGIPEAATAPAPLIPTRGAVRLGRLERRLRLAAAEARWREAVASGSDDADLASTRTADFYDTVVRRSRGVGSQVALASFSLPVEVDSPEPAIRFYEGAYPKLRLWILANRRHDRLLRGLAGAWRVTFVDTSPGLSGAYEGAFFDPLRLTTAGQERLARNVVAAIHPLLEKPRPGCVPVPATPLVE